MKGTQNFTKLVLFGIGLMLKGNEILADKKVTFAEGVDASLYVGAKLPSVYKALPEAFLEFKDLEKDEIAELQKKLVKEIRIDGVAPTNERAVWIIHNALDVAISVYNLVNSFKGEIPQDFNIDTLYAAIKPTTYTDTITT